MPASVSPSGSLSAKIQSLPQAAAIPAATRQAWLDAADSLDPGLAEGLLAAAAGFGARDVEVLLAARAGRFHPLASAREVTRAKLLLDPPAAPAGRQRREAALTALAQDHYRHRAAAAGATVRPDLLQRLASASLPQAPWLSGDPDGAVDLVEENGKLVLVDHGLAQAGQWERDPADDRQAVRLHHHLLRARAAGLQVDLLRAHAFDTDRWEGQVRTVQADPALEQSILEAGNHFWQTCVLAGTPVPEVGVGGSTALADLQIKVDGADVQVPLAAPDARTADGDPVVVGHYALTPETVDRLREQLAVLGAEVFGQAMVKAEAEKMRESLTRLIREILPTQVLPLDLRRLDLGPVRLKVDWNFQEEPLLEACRGALAMMGQEDEQIEGMLDADNFHHPATWSGSELVRLLKEKKGIDARTDPDLAPAMETDRRWRQDTLVALLKDLERMLPEPVRWNELVDHDGSQVGVEVARAPVAGPGRELREQTLERVRQATSPLALEVGLEHARKMAQMPGSIPARRKKAGP